MKAIVIVLGAVLALSGLAAGAAGGILFGVFGSDGTVASGSQRISTTRTALVSDTADLSHVSDLGDVVGDVRLRFSARGDQPFIGIGPARQVERYLSGAPIDEVTDFQVDPFKLERRPRAGTSRPAPPAQQDFWTARATGTGSTTLRWKAHDGDFRLVLMNADASRGVTLAADVGLTLDHVDRLAWGLIGGGALLLIGGIAAITVALRSRPAQARVAGASGP
jgi:hypothetical protein